MGPNGSGKSTLASVLAGRENYEVTSGEVIYNGKNLLDLSPEERAQAGIFLAFQYPVEIAGVSNATFLKEALNSIREANGKEKLDSKDFLILMREKMKLVEMDKAMTQRSVNEGFSGGEKKRNEIFQMQQPNSIWTADSGLDIDATKYGVNHYGIKRSFLSSIPPAAVVICMICSLLLMKIAKAEQKNSLLNWKKRVTIG
jgi:Fe-S cluster assembly ATP-binding protein